MSERLTHIIYQVSVECIYVTGFIWEYTDIFKWTAGARMS